MSSKKDYSPPSLPPAGLDSIETRKISPALSPSFGMVEEFPTVSVEEAEDVETTMSERYTHRHFYYFYHSLTVFVMIVKDTISLTKEIVLIFSPSIFKDIL